MTFDGKALTSNGAPVTVRTDANGAAQGSFSVPAAPKGPHTIGAAGGGITATAPFQVTPRIRVFPNGGAPGTTLKIALTGYAPREPVRVRWVRPDGTSTTMTVKLGSGTTTSTPTVSSSGSGTYTFAVPTNAGVGVARIHADGTTTTSRASVAFGVADCPLSLTSGRAGTRITASCAGFRAGETVSVYWDSTATTAISSLVVGPDGAGTASFTVPPAAGGAHKVIFKGMGSGWSVEESLTVKPFLALTPATARAGATINAQLHGFKPGESICLRWYITSTSTRTLTCNLVANTVGSSPSFTFTVPTDATAGTHKIEGRGSLGSLTTRNFNVTVTAAAQPTPTPVPNAAPTAVAGADQAVIDEDGDGVVEVTLDGSASADPEGGRLSYRWSLDDGTALAASARVVVAVPVGTHPFTLTVTDTAGATASDEVVVMVEAAPAPIATPTANASPTANAGADQSLVDEDEDGVVEVTLDGTASTDPEGGPLTYTWTLADGTPLATLTEPGLVVAVPVGSHTFTLTVTDAGGATASDEVVVVVQSATP